MTSLTGYAVRDEELDAVADEWETLLSQPSQSDVFLHPAWLRAWRHVFGDARSLRVMTVRDASGLQGVGAFVVEGDTLVLAGDPEIWDYAGIAAAAGQ